MGAWGPVAAGDSCTLAISFAPQGKGARSATLQISSNDASSPASVPLSGTGGSLPQGPSGNNGTNGTNGKNGKNGQIELVVCHKVTTTTTVNGHKVKKTVQKCTTRLVSGPVKFTIDGDDLGASVSRAGIVYARGYAVPEGRGRYQLVLHRLRRARPGRYTLTLRQRGGKHQIVHRTQITLR